MRGLFTEGNLCFKIDRASPIVGSKFTVFALFYFVFESNFPSTSPRGAYIWRDFFVTGLGGLYMEGLIFGILRYITSLHQKCPDPPLVRMCVLRANNEIPLGNANIIITRLLSGATFKFTILWKLFIWRRQTRTYTSQ